MSGTRLTTTLGQWLRLAAPLALCAGLGAAPALAQTPRERSPWESFGTYEVRHAAPADAQIVRMVRFPNGEFLAEIEAKESKKQRLQVQPSHLALYSGLRDDESPKVGGKNPFMFLELAFAYPSLALAQAYPAGPAAIAEEWAEKEVLLEGRHPALLKARREAPDRVRFQLKLLSPPGLTIEGAWDGQRPAALPDTLSLANWQAEASPMPATLGEARQARSAGRK